MNFTTLNQLNSNAIIACDVSKDTINLVMKLGKRCIEREIKNHTITLENELFQLKTFAGRCGIQNIWVVAEPTGIYHEILFRAAKRIDLHTAYVSAESVAKMRVIETNDTGKTDIKDPHVIHTLASIGKTLQHRFLEEPYNLLRRWNKIYDSADKSAVKSKGAIRTLIKELFPDFDKKKEFIFGNSGKALMAKYKFNPYRIVKTGKKRFTSAMKKAVPRIKNITIDLVFNQALASIRNNVSPKLIELIELELIQRWQDLDRYADRKQQAKKSMEELYTQARCDDPKLPVARKGVITQFHLARIIAETGPLSDFNSWRKLMRFAGFNLCERQSGTYRGKTKISKKGRRLIRKVLNLIILPLIRKQGLYGSYYHHKKESMPGTKAMTAVSRHFLKMLYGMYRTGCEFNKTRVFTCESQFDQAA
ncbi:MAG: IS110 family transposase [candidate division Zixibacteria bacterium]|nr:IS110 family transposase [candidate division Zixibacteria bacterium]